MACLNMASLSSGVMPLVHCRTSNSSKRSCELPLSWADGAGGRTGVRARRTSFRDPDYASLSVGGRTFPSPDFVGLVCFLLSSLVCLASGWEQIGWHPSPPSSSVFLEGGLFQVAAMFLVSS